MVGSNNVTTWSAFYPYFSNSGGAACCPEAFDLESLETALEL